MSATRIDSQFDIDSAYAHLYSLCEHTLGTTTPNPNVATAIYSADGTFIADGFHNRKISPDHAEVVALKKAGNASIGSTLIVSLEPCSHHGTTPPCTQAIIEAGIARVIYAVKDPHPIASGGADVLRQAGIDVQFIESSSLSFIQRAWLHKIKNSRPLMIWKVATTLDGKVAASDGTSQWITGEAAREGVQLLRSQSDAILVGTGTAERDNPTLVPRGYDARPIRIVVGERELSSESNLFDNQAETIQIKSKNPADVIAILNSRDVNQVLVEAGPTLGSVLLAEDSIDEIIIYQAPKILGSGSNFISDLGINTLTDHIALELISTEQIGDDIKSHYRIRRNS